MRTFFQSVVFWFIALTVWEDVLHYPWWSLVIVVAVAVILDLVLTVIFGQED